ncbi:ras guanine nucleotide exchange factor domain-containing protein [Lentinula aff. detonsa]|uniref:Ras guanine nucleotide exchange factor domain-containing protein n=1 Tax=Lentinula aff. detonsa TaxID=2804958 RepID=A0AA38NUA4_9AGAR|nr:ras guanine nucleotide exchange factor domain-containing protein [Lentinula aff. detonsa]
MSASSKPVSSETRHNMKLKDKTTAGPVVYLPTPPPSLLTRRRRSSSINSDDTSKATFLPRPENTPSSSSSRSKYNILAGHPSLFRSIKLLRALRGSSDVPGARALAQVLFSSITNVVHLMRVPQDVKDDHKYLENIQAVYFMLQQFQKEVDKSEQVNGLKEAPTVVRIIDIAELSVAALERLLGLTERMVKPLPGIPTDSLEGAEGHAPSSTSHLRFPKNSLADSSFARMSLAQITTEVLDSPPEDSAKSSSSSSSATSTIITILHKARQKSVLGSLFRNKSDSVSSSDDEYPQYAPRHSALYYPVDPLNPNVDIDLPPMSEDAMDITLSHDSRQMVKMSLTAVVRLLTSKDAIQDPCLLHWFFTTFRYVLLPSEVLDLLISRFNEAMPDEPMDQKQMRVWCNNHAKIVRPRVISVLIRWLSQFWEPPYDNICILNDMQDFVLKQVAGSLLPDRLGIAFAQAVKGVRVDGVTRTTWLQNRYQNMSASCLSTTLPYAFVAKCETKFPLEAFDCPTGHKAFAEQLTRLAAGVWAQLPTQALIRMWLERKTRNCEARSAAKLCDMKERNRAIGMQLKTLLQQADESTNRMLIGTLKSQRKTLLKQSNHLAGQIRAYETTVEEINALKKHAEHAATAVRHFDRSLFMFVINTVLLEAENEGEMVRAIRFWFRVCAFCYEMKNNSCAFTIFIGIANMSYVWRLVEVLPALDSLTHELHDKFCTIFERNEPRLNADELQDTQLGTIACVPRFHNVEKSITHIAYASTTLMIDNSVHANHLRVIGKVISAIEAPRLYTLLEDNSVRSLIQDHLSRFNVADEAAHMNAFEFRTNQLKPRHPRTSPPNTPATASPLLSPPSSPQSQRNLRV